MDDFEQISSSDNNDEFVDPDPITIVLEIANLAFQPGSLALIASLAGSAGAVATAITERQALSDKKRTEIRRHLFNVDRSLTEGASSLTKLASLLEQFNYIDQPMRLGSAIIRGFKNAQLLRRIHEDCRAAVKESRDAFMGLSAVLPGKHAEIISHTLQDLNALANPMLGFEKRYGVFLVSAALALTRVDNLICEIGKDYDFIRDPKDFVAEIQQAFPSLRRYEPSEG